MSGEQASDAAEERGHLTPESLAALVDARLADQAAAWRSRRDAKAAARAEFAERRRHGLAARHAAKLQRIRERRDR